MSNYDNTKKLLEEAGFTHHEVGGVLLELRRYMDATPWEEDLCSEAIVGALEAIAEVQNRAWSGNFFVRQRVSKRLARYMHKEHDAEGRSDKTFLYPWYRPAPSYVPRECVYEGCRRELPDIPTMKYCEQHSEIVRLEKKRERMRRYRERKNGILEED